MSPLDVFISTQVFAFLMIFARIGCAFMVMPGLSDSTVPMDVRLYTALTFSFVLTPVLMRFLPAIPTEPVAFGLLVIKEMLVGIFIGLMTQIMMNAINLAGVVVAHATSLSSAFTFNPQYANQSPIVMGFLSIVTVTLLFVSDLHHVLLTGFIDSYQSFPVQGNLMPGDMADSYAQALSDALRLGLMISTPFMVIAFGVFIAMGLVARLVPQIQVFALSVPVQIITGMIVLMTSLSAVMLYFLDEYEAFWRAFIGMN